MKRMTPQKMRVVGWLWTIAAILYFVFAISSLWNINFDSAIKVYYLQLIIHLINLFLYSALVIIWWVKYARIKHLADDNKLLN
ncbi:MAG: hypothetical protein FWF37_00740 [Chloroflexi bacterium]|nr:hypothetical protein [Chloroflexota bacterium]